MISFDIKDFEKACDTRPTGYREHVLSMATVSSGRIWLKPEDYTYLANYYRQGTPPEPRIIDSAENLVRALKRWGSAGFPVASTRDIASRKATCEKCPYWDGQARMGLGKCNHEKCGCSRLKWWLATEECPDGRWQQIVVEEGSNTGTLDSLSQ